MSPPTGTGRRKPGGREQQPDEPWRERLATRHLAFGWIALLVFLVLGIALEALHALKLGLYLDVGNETRRLMWTLAHAHGTLLGLVHVAFAATLPRLPDLTATRGGLASRLLLAGTAAMPLGFLLGGVFVHAGDPGLPIVLVPVGAALLLGGVAIVAAAALGAWRAARSDRERA